MSFEKLNQELNKSIESMLKDQDHLFTVNLDKDRLWATYLESFSGNSNPLFRERTEHDCSACRQFAKNFGNVVSIVDNQIRTIWDFTPSDEIYQGPIKALADVVRSHPIEDVFVTNESSFGILKNIEERDGKLFTWHHFHTRLPQKFVTRSKDSIPTIKGNFRDSRNVFKRSLQEITPEAVEIVLELISQNTLYKGEEWKNTIEKFQQFQRVYNSTPDLEKEAYVWSASLTAGIAVNRIRNHSIGVLLQDLSEDMDLDKALRRYENVVAPSNYKRPKAVFTQKMLEEAKKVLEEDGLLPSLERRFATLEDIKANNILFLNRDSVKKTSDDAFEGLAVSKGPKSFSRVEEITVEDFVNKVLPTAKSIEAFLENSHAGNMVSLIAPVNADSKSLFKWDNGFSWAYSGNMTDSMKERVKSMGGKVDGVLRCSLQWNENGDNNDDLDLHCSTPVSEIYYGTKNCRRTGGFLDVDIINPVSQIQNGVAVENIAWASKSEMLPGNYLFVVHCFNHRGGRGGFSAEVEFDGRIYSFNYNRDLRYKENIPVAKVNLSPSGVFSIEELLPSSSSSRKVWGLSTGDFHPVSTVMYSPNFWDNQEGIGHRHYFFMLKNAVNEESPNGFFNEYLKEDFTKHKRVFEALGSKMKAAPTPDQLSGIGFSSTKRNSLVVKIEGATKRILKINF